MQDLTTKPENSLRHMLVMAASSGDILKLLEKVEKPGEHLKDAVKALKKLVKKKEEAEKEYGYVVDLKGLMKVYKILDKIDKPEKPVAQAIKALKKILGIEDEGSEVPPLPKNVLPGYFAGKLQASATPGVYRARLIRAGDALDGKNWGKEALMAAVDNKLFESVPVNVITYTGQYGEREFHLPEDSPFVGQISGNQVGYCKDATWDEEDESVMGYVYITDPSRRELIDSMLDENMDKPGMSIYASGNMDDDQLVDDISVIHSMDLVTFPAADGAILSQRLEAALKNVYSAEGAPQPKQEQPAPTEDAVVAPTDPKEGLDEGAALESDKTWKDRLDSDIQFTAEFGMLASEKGSSIKWEDLTTILMSVRDKWSQSWDQTQTETYDEFAEEFWTKDEILSELLGTEKEAESPIEKGEVEEEVSRGDQIAKGGNMSTKTVEAAMAKRLEKAEESLVELQSRVEAVDTEAMIDEKLGASKLPDQAKEAIKESLSGKVVSASTVDGFIDHSEKLIGGLESNLADSGINISGESLEKPNAAKGANPIADMLGITGGEK